MASSPASASTAVPTAKRVAAARHYAQTRLGTISFTVVDTNGRSYGDAGDRPFVTASVVKAMLLAVFLNLHTFSETPLSVVDERELAAMIEVSDNDAATWVYDQVGDARLEAFAKRMGMRNFSVSGTWGDAQLTTNDQARFMARLDRAIYSRRYLAYAKSLLSSIVSYESWGIPQAARGLGWRVYFKGGWRTTVNGQLVHQVARLERGGTVLVICVMTDGDPSSAYGQETIEGIARRLLGATR